MFYKTKFNILIFLLTLAVAISVFFLTQSEEQYLKKKTLKLIQVISTAPPASEQAKSVEQALPAPQFPPESHLTLLRKAQSITKYVHFSIDYQVQINTYSYQNRTLNRLRSDLFSYFKNRGKYKVNIKIPNKKDITVAFSENQKKAEVKFTTSIFYKGRPFSGVVVITWKKEKTWLIYKVQALNHP